MLPFIKPSDIDFSVSIKLLFLINVIVNNYKCKHSIIQNKLFYITPRRIKRRGHASKFKRGRMNVHEVLKIYLEFSVGTAL